VTALNHPPQARGEEGAGQEKESSGPTKAAFSVYLVWLIKLQSGGKTGPKRVGKAAAWIAKKDSTSNKAVEEASDRR